MGSKQLRLLRKKLARNRLTMPLFDTKGWVRDFEKALKIQWEIYGRFMQTACRRCTLWSRAPTASTASKCSRGLPLLAWLRRIHDAARPSASVPQHGSAHTIPAEFMTPPERHHHITILHCGRGWEGFSRNPFSTRSRSRARALR